MGIRSLLAAGRRHSATDQEMVQTIHDQSVALGAMCAGVQEAGGLSFHQTEDTLSKALRAQYPGTREIWVRDVYDDYVIYTVIPERSAEERTYRRPYALVDGQVTFGDAVEVVPTTVYLPVEESLIVEVIRQEGGQWVLYSRDGKKRLGVFDSKEEALKRERQIQFYKAHEAKHVIPEDVEVDLAGYEPTEEELAAALEVVRKSLEKKESGCEVCDGLLALALEEAKGGSSTLVSTFGTWAGGKHETCVAKLKGKSGITDPERLCAWLKDRYTGSTSWRGKHTKMKASGSVELTSDLVPLVERAVRKDGTVKIKIIAPGKGSSGYYPPDVLKRDGPKVFTEGLHMYLDHPTPEEEAGRPERSVRDLAGVLTSTAQWDDSGPAGPGLYAEAKVRSDVAPLIEELAPHIGVSIRALGRIGERDGERVVESIEQARSVDFVTIPGAGGKVLELLESSRGRVVQEEEDVDLQETQKMVQEQAAEIARLREALTLREARDVVEQILREIPMPDLTRQRLVRECAANPPVREGGTLDVEALTKAVKERAQAELDYVARIVGSGRVTGMGVSPAPTSDDAEKALGESLKRLLGDEKLAAVAAAGRGN